MNHADHLHPWCIIRLQPNLQHLVLNCFQRRHEAEAHLRVLKQMMPAANYTIMFDNSAEEVEVGFGKQRLYS